VFPPQGQLPLQLAPDDEDLSMAVRINAKRLSDSSHDATENSTPSTPLPSTPDLASFPGSRIWFQMLRPELVNQWPVPLASNGFSGFLAGDSRRAEMNASLNACTRYLVRVRVREFVDFIKPGK
jgi:hypothetical protein